MSRDGGPIKPGTGTLKPGMGIPIKLEDLVKPWIGSTIWVQFDTGEKAAARILSVEEGFAQVMVTEVNTKEPL